MAVLRAQLVMLMVVAMLGACKPSKPRPDAELERTAKRLWTECDGGSAASCLELDRVLGDARVRGSLRNSYGTARLQERACKAGHGASCYEVARRMPARSSKDMFERGCTVGHAPSCKELGDWHMHSYFGEANTDLAAAAYTRACDLGDRSACTLAKEAAVPRPKEVPIPAHDP